MSEYSTGVWRDGSIKLLMQCLLFVENSKNLALMLESSIVLWNDTYLCGGSQFMKYIFYAVADF